MSRGRRTLGLTAGALGVAAAGGAAAKLAQQRRVMARRGAGEAVGFGELRSPGLKVVTDDGIDLHVEIDEPDAPPAPGEPDLTVVFVHGYTLTLDSWHFQRAAYRGEIRTVFYDLRSHGRSARAPGESCTIEQLGRDLRRVIETTAPGPVIVVGHSMGGMSVISLAQQFPELFADKVVGSALIATTAGGLDPGRIIFPMVPLGLGGRAVSRAVRILDRGHLLVDRLRGAGHRFARVVADHYSFGADVPRSYVDFVYGMIDDTPFEVVAGFYPAFATLDHFDHLEALAQAPCSIVCGTEDRMTRIGHSRKLHARIHGSDLFEAVGAGHMVMLESHDEVNRELDDLIARASLLAKEREA
ncbi:alpha/beta fold hydrolase [Nocardioides campestrisoli]|uniref:alpha/beta fold hydrolase n=1 Tax=Nocardioides campestrisoli TaxID=2736757 RepID=UPI001CD81109|nr:alpha/beta hydrolase [Nocardioides campestrisoli]